MGQQGLSSTISELNKKVEDSIEETLDYCDFPSRHWTRIRTNDVIERLNREICLSALHRQKRHAKRP